MPYRIYRRHHDQTIDPATRTTTSNPSVAEAAFRALMLTRDYWATKSAAVLTLDGRQLEFRRFDRLRMVRPELDDLLRRHGLPRGRRVLILPFDQAEWDAALRAGTDPDHFQVGVLSGARDDLVLDPEQSIRLFHDDPDT
jgi:hypothetical protein